MIPYEILRGDCIEQMRAIPDNTFDSIVTDPPYELGFMGRAWDASGIANNPVMWGEALRVLKPGGHLLAFSGSRTYHRMVCAIEDAGFEIRDQIMWVYGSGFPKSMDVSKAIDKLDATEMRRARQLRFTEWMRATGLTSARIDEITGTNMGGHYTTAASQPAVATREHFEKLRPFFPAEVPAWVEAMVDERTVESLNFQKREFFDTPTGGLHGGSGNTVGSFTGRQAKPGGVTEAARAWEGWGTALKPAHEPIVVARKPLGAKTVAANVLAHGTGAINVDGCRVDGGPRPLIIGQPKNGEFGGEFRQGSSAGGETTQGRWPANLIHDGSDEVVALFPESAVSGSAKSGTRSEAETEGMFGHRVQGKLHNDSGSAARFFYCAKASKSDRGPGNTHPTVKPLALMQYLCRLVTPPGGHILEPFAGSGTTIVAGIREGFRVTAIELIEEHADIAEARVDEELYGDIL